MFLAHFAAAFAAKPVSPRTSLGVLTAAALLPDLIWPVFVLAGWEHVLVDPGNTAVTALAFIDYPISHSLLTDAAWGFLLAWGYWSVKRDARGALLAGAVVLSHWMLDAVSHVPDLPLYPGSDLYAGLGLWNSVAGTVVVELALFGAGVWLYVRQRRRVSRWFWGLAVCLLALYGASLLAPAPPSSRAVGLVGLAGWLFPAWAWWADR